MKTILLLTMLIGLTSCEMPPESAIHSSAVALVHAAAPPPNRDAIRELRHLAKTRHQRWRIFCTGNENPSEKFLAELCIADCDIIFAEEGAKGSWSEFGSTQSNAAAHLVDAVIAGGLMEAPMHHENWKHKQCSEPTISDKTEKP